LSVQSSEKRKLKKDKVYRREDVWHFDQEMTDEQFLQVVVHKMEPLGLEIAYDVFQDFFLPKHRKPNFSDWCRFRRLENLIAL
jgi:mannose-6-phosphate isomerase-like protein (cupin superfamily)